MHVDVDGAGQNMKPGGVEGFARRRHEFIGTDGANETVLDGDAGRNDRLGRDDEAAADDQIDNARHPSSLTASPTRRRPEDRRR